MFNSIDQQTDYSNKELYTFLTNSILPPFVKEASLEEVKDVDGLQKEAFADPLGRTFPINTPARAYVSTAFFVNKMAAIQELRGQKYVEKIATALDEAAQIHGITEEISDLNKAACARLVEEYPDHTIIFKVAHDHFDLFTIKTAQDLENAANTFVEKLANYPYEWRRGICEEFVKAAEALNVDELPALVLKYAGQYYPDIVQVKQELARRMTKLSADNQKRYQDLIGDVNNMSDKEEVFKLAECCYFTEKNAGLYDNNYYRKILGDPVDQLFTMHFDKVAEALDNIKLGNELFSFSDLEKISTEKYEQAFGLPLNPKEAEFRDIAPTLPRSDVALFKELTGIKPV